MKIPFKGNGNSVVCAYRFGELKLYRNSMTNYFKSNDYKLSQNLKSLFIYFSQRNFIMNIIR